MIESFALSHPVANALAVLGLVAALGLALGAFRICGVGLGVAGVLFAGLVLGHFGFRIDPAMLDLMRDFGLVLFIYSIGMTIGSGFLRSLRRQGLALNALAAAIVLLGAALAVSFSVWGHIDIAAAVGLFSGATTNTPALAAAQDALKSLDHAGASRLGLPAIGYAIAYPFGIVGIILSMLLVRWFFRVDTMEEEKSLRSEEEEPLDRQCVKIENPEIEGRTVDEISKGVDYAVTISRMQPAAGREPRMVRPDMRVHCGDVLMAIGAHAQLAAFITAVGAVSELDLRKSPGRILSRWVIVTNEDLLGKSLAQLAAEETCAVRVTRVKRLDIEQPAQAGLRLRFGDRLLVVGEEAGLRQMERQMGNSRGALDRLNIMALFIGLTLGILAGHVPIPVPGIPTPVRLGIAGGPLLVAIALSHIGNIGRLSWYMPVGASSALRDLGISLFLACVGLKAGSHFLSTLLSADGLYWMACGAVITLLPLLAVAAFARLAMKLNFLKICGLLAGSMTDPPALAFATSLVKSETPAVAYATVYPVTMVLRILVVQLILIYFGR